MLCYIGKLTVNAMQSSKKSERNGRRARRRKSNNAKKPTVLAQLQLLLMDSLPRTHHLKVLTHQLDQFNYHQLATSQAQQFPTNIRQRPPLEVSNNCKSMVTTMLCNIQATQHRLMALQIRCITTVITPSLFLHHRIMLILCLANGAQPKYEH
jgi:hypothetical protein